MAVNNANAWQDLAVGELDFRTSFAQDVRVNYVSVKSHIPISETIRIILDSGKGSPYDLTMVEEALSGERNFIFYPEGDLLLKGNDELRILCSNSGGVGHVAVVVSIEEA